MRIKLFLDTQISCSLRGNTREESRTRHVNLHYELWQKYIMYFYSVTITVVRYLTLKNSFNTPVKFYFLIFTSFTKSKYSTLLRKVYLVDKQNWSVRVHDLTLLPDSPIFWGSNGLGYFDIGRLDIWIIRFIFTKSIWHQSKLISKLRTVAKISTFLYIHY